MAISFPVTVITGIHMDFIEPDVLYRGHVFIQVLGAFGAHTTRYEFEGPSWTAVAEIILGYLTSVATANNAPALNEEAP